ncbi:MAG: hypothetical protein K8E24_002985 [Methanobacterium paludis]|nr:hypothetical protein [Methanobacterium paludis]
MVNKNEGWEEVNDVNSVWRPEATGEEIIGVYKSKETDVGQYKSNIYTLETDDGEREVYGSKGLDGKFADIPIGYEVRIVYKGEKPMAPPKKPFKMFQVFKRPGNGSSGSPQMMGKEDPEAETIIQMLEEEISAKHKGNVKPSLEETVDLAAKYCDDKDCKDIDSMMLTRIKVVLAERG